MTTALRKAKGAAGFAYTMDERGRSPLDHLPPPANSNKPLTPFSIEDILSKPSVRRRSFAVCAAALGSPGLGEKGSQLGGPGVAGAPGLGRQSAVAQASPLCALEELASKTFKGLEVSVLQAAEGKGGRWLGRGSSACFCLLGPRLGSFGPSRGLERSHLCCSCCYFALSILYFTLLNIDICCF